MRVAAVLVLVAASAALAGGTPREKWMSAAAWSAHTRPKGGPVRAVGFYNAGCVQGAVALPPSGPGFEVLHLGRRRFFGHPLLVDYVRRLSREAQARGLPILLIGDLSQARGGPTPTDHTSHQSGLDVDISYTRPADSLWRPLEPAVLERVSFPVVVDLERQMLTGDWRPAIAELLEIAASDPVVDRVFVNPVVKRDLCSRERAPWLRRIRPGRAHHDHFHVRLACPKGSRECREHPAPPSDDGCGDELEWWFSAKARASAPKTTHAPPRPKLPALCREISR